MRKFIIPRNVRIQIYKCNKYLICNIFYTLISKFILNYFVNLKQVVIFLKIFNQIYLLIMLHRNFQNSKKICVMVNIKHIDFMAKINTCHSKHIEGISKMYIVIET